MLVPYIQPSTDIYSQYYSIQSQTGGAATYNPIRVYRGSAYQRGYGIGSVFSSIFRSIAPIFRNVIKSPLFKQAASTVGQRALSTGMNLGEDILKGENVKQALKSRLKETGEQLLGDAQDMWRQQSGTGRKRKRLGTVQKRRKRRRVVKKKNTKPKRQSKRRRVKKQRDIFD